MLTFQTLSKINLERCTAAFPECNEWYIVDWSNAAAGEVGEMCNIVKKIRRGDLTLMDPEHKRRLAHEMADVLIYLDLMASKVGIDLEAAVIEKFNIVSRLRHVSIFLEDEQG